MIRSKHIAEIRAAKIRAAKRPLLLLAAGAGALLFAGCGGSQTNNDNLGKTPGAGPLIEAVLGLVNTNIPLPSSGTNSVPAQLCGFGLLANPAQPTGADVPYRTIETAQRVLTGNPPLSNGVGSSAYSNVTAAFGGVAVPVGGQFGLRADIVNGQAAGSRTVIPINPGKTVLTSSEVAGFSVPLAFAFKSDGSAAGAFASATYASANVAVPFTTTGLHALTATVTDTSGQSDATDFLVAVVGPSDAAVVPQVYFPNPDTGAPGSPNADAAGDAAASVTITNAVAGATAQGTTDLAGLATLFAAPGPQTISVAYTYTDANKVVHNYAATANVTLAAGQTDTSLEGAKAILLTEVTGGAARRR